MRPARYYYTTDNDRGQLLSRDGPPTQTADRTIIYTSEHTGIHAFDHELAAILRTEDHRVNTIETALESGPNTSMIVSCDPPKTPDGDQR
jgi:hypothetical protein